MRYVRLILYCSFCIATSSIFAQNIRGQVIDKEDDAPLNGVSIFLLNKTDTTYKTGTNSDESGNFFLSNLAKGSYLLRVNYIGYKTLEQSIDISDTATKNLGKLRMVPDALVTQTVTIEGRQVRSIQKGDTTEHNANAYKTNPDASAQDLITKMPGVTLENGTLKAQGETVQKVLIDGKEFFGEDASIALKNLPAEIIDKIQVFDRQSDQSQFTGFNDGNTQKSINIVTKPGKNNGSFGKVYAGYGTNDRYTAGLNVNTFNGNRRISLIGLSNNINLQNFSAQDLLGVQGSSNQGQGRGTGGSGGFGGSSGRGSGAASNNFIVPQQGGITTTNSIGVNYSDSWGKKITATASYFFNNSYNTSRTNKARNYFLTDSTEQFYDENSDAGNDNYNHRANARIEYKIDTSNSLLFTPKLSFQNNQSNASLYGANYLSKNSLLSDLSSKTINSSRGYDFSGDLLYRHKFKKRGRTISTSIGTSINDKTGTSNLLSQNRFYQPVDSISILNQKTNSNSNGTTLSANLVYTEPISKIGSLMINYSPSYNQNFSNKETNALNTSTGEYSIMNNVLSNRFENNVVTQRAGAGYRISTQKLNMVVGANYQNVILKGQQLYPVSFLVEKDFNNLLPSAMLNYKFTATKNLRIFYRSSTNVPSISQLQNVINNANPLQLSTGNPDLKQELTHMIMTRYGYTNGEKATSFNAFINTSFTSNYIGSSTLIATENARLNENVVLNRGSQLTRPVNLEGYVSLNSFATYGFPFTFIKSNLNVNLGYFYTRTPSLINTERNEANSSTINSGFTLGSNISEKLDFTIAYATNYNIVQNSIRPNLNNNYFYHTASFKFNLLPWKGLLLGSELTNTLYNGLGPEFNLNYFLWNPYIGYKFLKNNAAEIRLTAFDMLEQNTSISRNVTSSYIEDVQTLVLQRYFMATLTYNIRKFAAKPTNPDSK